MYLMKKARDIVTFKNIMCTAVRTLLLPVDMIHLQQFPLTGYKGNCNHFCVK